MEIQQISESRTKGNFKRGIQDPSLWTFSVWLTITYPFFHHISISFKLPSLTAVSCFVFFFHSDMHHYHKIETILYQCQIYITCMDKIKHTLRATFAFKLSSSSPVSWLFWKWDQEIVDPFQMTNFILEL